MSGIALVRVVEFFWARKGSLFVVDDPHEETLWRTRNIVTGGSRI